MANIVCIKWGARFGADYVNKLASMVRRNCSIDHRFVCFTDDRTGIESDVETMPLPDFREPPVFPDPQPPGAYAPWRKLSILHPELGGLAGRSLYLDLDVVITGSIDDLFGYSDRLATSENWTQRGQGIGNTSVYTFEIGQFAAVWQRYHDEFATLFQEYSNSQTFMCETIGRDNIVWWPDDWVVSFKHSCMPKFPMNWLSVPKLMPETRIVVFHGSPKPSDAIEGRYPGKWHKHCRPTPWVAEHWR